MKNKEQLKVIRMKVIRNRFLWRTVGIGLSKQELANIRNQIQKLDGNVTRLIEKQIMDCSKKNYGSFGMVGSINHPDISFSGFYYGRPRMMAQAYACPASRYYKSPELLKRITAALEFGEQFIRPGVKRVGNWWPWDIGIPLALISTMLYCGDSLPPDLGDKIITALESLPSQLFKTERGKGIANRIVSGTNFMWVLKNHLMMGVLLGDTQYLDDAQKQIDIALGVNRKGYQPGIQPDWSFHFHGRGLHFGYGRHLLVDTAEWIYLTDGTRWEVSSKLKRTHLNYFLEFAQWNVYRGRTSPYTIGREIARPGAVFDDRGVGSAALYLLHSNFDEEARKQAIRSIADWLTCPPRDEHYLHLLYPENFVTTAILFSSVRKRVEKEKGRLYGAKYYPWSDYLVVRRENWFCALRMCSVRTKNWFSINDENKKGWYSGEGTLVLMTDGREYGDDIIASQSWENLLGITRSINLKPRSEQVGQSSFVGGVAHANLDCAGMDYLLEQEGTKKVCGKKSYFFTKDYLILLGSDISAKGKDVIAETSLFSIPIFENSVVKLDGKDMLNDTTIFLRKGEHKLFIHNTALWIPDGTNIRLEVRTLAGDYHEINSLEKSRKYCHRHIHLIKEQDQINSGYQIVIAPAVKSSLPVNRGKRPEVILCNTKGHLIQSRDGRVFQMIAYEPLEMKGLLSVNKPAFLQWEIDETDSLLALSVATNVEVVRAHPEVGKESKMQIIIDKVLSLAEEYADVTLKKSGAKTILDAIVRDGWTRTVKFRTS